MSVLEDSPSASVWVVSVEDTIDHAIHVSQPNDRCAPRHITVTVTAEGCEPQSVANHSNGRSRSPTLDRTPERRDHDGVEHRAPVGLRAFVAIIALGMVLFNVALLLSDRAPKALRMLFGDFAGQLSNRLDSSGQASNALEARNVGSDSLVHLGLWAATTILIGIAVWSWIGLAMSAIVVSGGSLLTEIAQGRYSSTRAVESKDAMFNLLGVAMGTAAVALLYLGYGAVTGRAAVRDRRSTT
jgi:hypothetical protein